MMNGIATQLDFILNACKQNVHVVFMLLAVLWGIQIINALLRYRLNYLGLVPRQLRGIPGIFFSPFLHGSFEHLFMNSLALFILINLVLISGLHVFLMVSLFIIVVGGLLVWLFGRDSIHVGASGLIMGYWGFVLLSAYHAGTVLAILLGVLCLFYLRGLIVNLFHHDKKTSWEGHVFGFIAGVLAVFCLPLV